MRKTLHLSDYVHGIENQDRTILGRALSLVESANPQHRKLANELLTQLKIKKQAKIIGITGTPGVGKSTFIESFGNYLIEQGLKVAVLAIDPSSVKTGGSILGDKTRMQQLSARDEAFIRPTASGQTLGGVASRTRESILICEAYGFDVILVETVGVGQSEVAISKMVDFFLLLMQPGSGDDLQGIKRGILEVCHLVAVTKADGELLNKAKLAQTEFTLAIKILRSQEEFIPQVLTCSAQENTGITEIWNEIEKYFKSHDIAKERDQHLGSWLSDSIHEQLFERLQHHKGYQKQLAMALKKIASSQSSVSEISEQLIEKILKGEFHGQ